MSLNARLKKRFDWLRPIDEMEVALVRAATERPAGLDGRRLEVLRYALNLARLDAVPGPGGDVLVGAALTPFRERLVMTLRPWILETPGVVELEELSAVTERVATTTLRARAELLRTFAALIPEEVLEREVCEKALVVVAGGGGGAGYVYGGAFQLIDEVGRPPSMIVGTSIGSLLGLFRAKRQAMELAPLVSLSESLTWRNVFLRPRVKNRYGVPAALRLYLRKAIGHLFQHEGGERTLRMGELEIPFRVVVAGVYGGGLTHDLDYYEHLMDDVMASERVSWSTIRKTVGAAVGVLSEFVQRPAVLKEIVLGGDELTSQFDVVDAVGFSTAVPGLIHYDILREDPHMHAMMERLMEKHGVARLIDGGLVNNVPSRVAWTHVQRGDIGTRNAFILAMDCFAPQLARNLLMHPVQRLVRPQVSANAAFASFTKTFSNVLSPLDVVPDLKKIQVALRNGYAEMDTERRFLAAMLRPLDPRAVAAFTSI